MDDARVRIVDESPAGAILHELTLVLATRRITVRALIERRVRDEVERWTAGGEPPRLVEPAGAEVELNSSRRRRSIDADAQCERALDAFARGRVLVIANDRQAASLDDEIALGPDALVVFVKLVPLVGG
jgi:hypothetical protein